MTQKISDHDLLARVLNVHDANRLGNVSREEAAHILSAYSDCEDNVAEHDLLSLRAAVRRVLEADLATTCNHKQPPLLRYALNSLRAEMARIDGNDPVVVERGGPAPTEALQKITEKQIQEGIDAALRGACKSVDELRRQMP